MRKKRLAVCDTDRDYVERFTRYAAKREGNPFEIQAFTDVPRLAEFIRGAGAELFLVGQVLLTEEVRQAVQAGEGILLVLADSPELVPEGCQAVYKYQSSERILRTAAGCMEERGAVAGRCTGYRTRIYGVFSPVKRCYKTTFSLILGQVLAERGAAVYLNLEDVAGFAELLAREFQEDLSDILYYHRVGEAGRLKLYSVVESLGKLCMVPPVSCPEDIRGTPPEEFRQLISAVAATDSYEFMVVDMGDGLLDPVPLLRLCNRIYMPVREDRASRAKASAYTEYLKSIGEGELLKRTSKFVIPVYGTLAEGWEDPWSLRRGAFGKYVEQMLQEEEGWS